MEQLISLLSAITYLYYYWVSFTQLGLYRTVIAF